MPQNDSKAGSKRPAPPVMANRDAMEIIREAFFEVTMAGQQLQRAPAPAEPAVVDQSGFLLDGKPLEPVRSGRTPDPGAMAPKRSGL